MKTTAIFYHAGCTVCVDAEQKLAHALDPAQYQLEIVHLGENRNRLDEAEKLGVKSVPALTIEGEVFHINFGAPIEALK